MGKFPSEKRQHIFGILINEELATRADRPRGRSHDRFVQPFWQRGERQAGDNVIGLAQLMIRQNGFHIGS